MRNIKSKIEYLLVFIALVAISFYVNREIVIKALFMDDLFHWSWFRGINIFEFGLKIYEGNNRYRPVFETLQYIVYAIVGTDPTRFTIVSKIYNALVALFIYHFVKKLHAGEIIAFLVSSFYLVCHLSYYQIGQAIGTLETTAQFLALVVLYYAVKLIGIFDGLKKLRKYDEVKKNIILMLIFYFLVSFTHERFMGLAGPMFFAILFMDKYKGVKKNEFKNVKIKAILSLVIEILIILIIRFISTDTVIPAGTGGTYVEETFSIKQFIIFCLNQIAIILGINIGPEHLVGVEFGAINNMNEKIWTLISIALILSVALIYVYKKFMNYRKDFKIDLIFLSFIGICIAASSVTIRVELRFVYVSFTASFIYLAYMISYIRENIDNKKLRSLFLILFACIIFLRVPVELEYRKYYDKIYCFVDLNRMNSLYDNTIGEYGLDETLHNKKIYVQNNLYGMTDFYSEYFFKIYDKENVGNKINLFHVVTELDFSDPDNTIVLLEDFDNSAYKPFTYEEYKNYLAHLRETN